MQRHNLRASKLSDKAKPPGFDPTASYLCSVSVSEPLFKTPYTQNIHAHQYKLLRGAEIRHGCSGAQVVRDALSVQQLVGLLCGDIYVDDATEDLLRGWCQDQREDVIGVIWVGRGCNQYRWVIRQTLEILKKYELDSIGKVHTMNIKCV